MFVSNWLMLIHQGEQLSAYKLIDISFYYFVPLITWISITFLFLKIQKYRSQEKQKLAAYVVWLFILAIIASPVIRTIDILLDFSIKYLIGMTQSSPWEVLNDVWLVVFSSIPWAFLKIVIIAILVFFLKEKRQKHVLPVKTIEGFHQVLNIHTILYLQSKGNYVTIYTLEGPHKIRTTLKDLESQLGTYFFRIHKSTIINSMYVKQLKHWRNGEYLLIMEDSKPLTSSRSFTKAIDHIKRAMEEKMVVAKRPESETVRPSVA